MGNRRSSNFGFRQKRSRQPMVVMIIFIVLALVAASISYIYWQKNKELIEQYEEEKIAEEIDVLGNFIDKLDQDVEKGIEEGDFIPYGGGLYDLLEDVWLTVDDVETDSADFEGAEVFYTDRCLFGYLEDGVYKVTDTEKVTASYGSKEEAEAAYLNGYGQTFEEGELLVRGDEDRRLIAETIRTEEKAKVLVYIRYLVSNGTDAFLISSPGEDTQVVDQYYFRKVEGEWTILGKADKDQGYEFLNSLGISDFSLALLPDYRVKDYVIHYLNDPDLYTLLEYLKDNGAADIQDTINYVSRVDNYGLVLLSGGNKVLVKFGAGDGLVAEDYQILDPNAGYATFHSLIDDDYRDARAPYFLFLQN